MFRVIVRNIPNFITISNCFLGFSSILSSFQAVIDFYLTAIGKQSGTSAQTYLLLAGLFILLAALIDLLDGAVARLLNVSSKMGQEMDSFSDLVCFGVAPGVLFFTVTLIAGNHLPVAELYYSIDNFIPRSVLPHIFILQLLAFIFPSSVLIRLARFNIKSDYTKPTIYFEGISSTFGGGLIALILTFNFIESPGVYLLGVFGIRSEFMEMVGSYVHVVFHDYFFLLVVYIFIAILMVTRIPYRKLNAFFKRFLKKKYWYLHIILIFLVLFFFRYLILVSAILYILFGFKRGKNPFSKQS